MLQKTELSNKSCKVWKTQKRKLKNGQRKQKTEIKSKTKQKPKERHKKI